MWWSSLADGLALERRVRGRPVACLGNGLACLPGRLQPVVFGDLDFADRLLRRVAEGGAREEVGDVGDVAVVLAAPEDVDGVVLHRSVSVV